MMKQYNELTSKVADQLNDINLRIRNRAYDSEKKNSWMCLKCRARIKLLDGVMQKPEQCECGSRDFK